MIYQTYPISFRFSMSQYDLLIFNMSDVEPTQRDNINYNIQNMYNRGDLDMNAPLGSYIVLRVLGSKANQVASEMSQYRFRMIPKGTSQYNMIASQESVPVNAIVSSTGQIPQLMQSYGMQQQTPSPGPASVQPVETSASTDDVLDVLKKNDNLMSSIFSSFTIDLPLKYDNVYFAEVLRRGSDAESIVKDKLKQEQKNVESFVKIYEKDDRIIELKKELRKAGVAGFFKKVGNLFRSKTKISTNKMDDFNDIMMQLDTDINKDIDEGQRLYKKYLLLLLIIHYTKLPESDVKKSVEPLYTALTRIGGDKYRANLDSILMSVKDQFKSLKLHLDDLQSIKTQYATKASREVESSASQTATAGGARKSRRASGKQMRRRLKRQL